MLTPETIASRRFDKQVGGYKQDEVEMFLQQVAGEYAKLLSEKEDLEEKIEVLAEKVEQYREDEDSLRSALIGAQKLGDSVIRNPRARRNISCGKHRHRQTRFWKTHRRASRRSRWL